MSRAAVKLDPFDADEERGGKPLQRVVPATGTRPPIGLPNSVFGVTKASPSGHVVPPEDIVIRRGIPKPTRGRGGAAYASVIEKLEPGDSVVLPLKQSLNFLGACRLFKKTRRLDWTFSHRKLDAATGGVWRDR